ncbi:ABC transporter permease [Hoyosella rhizosphaerae]|nr:ABC transporter permease subunit [Hoyosella rhizosphaerae]
MKPSKRFGRAFLVVWFALPFVPLILWAMANQWSFPAILPQQWGLNGARTAINAGAADAFVASTVLGLTVAALATPLGVLAGRALALYSVPFRGAFAIVLLTPLAFPPFAVAMGLDVLLLRVGVPGFAGVVLILTVIAIPYTTYIMRVGFGAYDVRYEEEAQTLGASKLFLMRHVQLPLLAPPIATAAFSAFLVGWTDYIVTLLIGGGRLVTVPILVGSFAAGTGNQAVTSALSVAAIVPPLLLLVAVLKFRGKAVTR